MATNPTPQRTDFSIDVLGRYICNGLDEALRSADRSRRPEARPFDVIVIGGGSFGPVLAQHLFERDTARRHRILVLDGGQFVLPEHVQNLPLVGLNVPPKTSIADQRAAGQDGKPRGEVWGLAWHSNEGFPGLAYCLGGRSLFFGGWSPQPLDAELPLSPWPVRTVADLKARYFREAARQIGTDETNDFLFGPLHEALRERLFAGLQAGTVTDAIPLAELPLTVDLPPELPETLQQQMKLEAPLAVQSRAGRSGFFPFNKFSALPLLMKAARAAQAESGGDDGKKRLMVVPNCHVLRLKTEAGRVTEVQTNLGNIPVPPEGLVVLALGTIESARLALLSFQGLPGAERIGQNLMVHLRSNVTIRIPREALSLNPTLNELQTSALFLKGRHRFADGSLGHFHLQITAAGLGRQGGDSEAELFKKVPDLDTLDRFETADDTHIVITLRGIGETQPGNPNSHVRLDPERDEYGLQRAFVAIGLVEKDRELWEAMDQATDQAAQVFSGGLDYEVLVGNETRKVPAGTPLRDVLPFAGRRDGLGTTHHEAGTLRMGDDPASSVTDADGRFHNVANAYVAGPALFPTVGSPNPMLTGVALSRRTADQILARDAAPRPEPGFTALFDGTLETFQRWQGVGGGSFALVDGAIVAQPGDGLGLLYYPAGAFGNFVLRLQVRLDRADDNSGVFVRFRDPAAEGSPGNPALSAVRTGFEVQIDELARGDPGQGIPDGLDQHRTGAIYGIPVGPGEGQQTYRRGPALSVGVWRNLEIKVAGDTYTVYLDNQPVSSFVNTNPSRGQAPGLIGLQAHTGRVAFRNIRILAFQAPAPPAVRGRLVTNASLLEPTGLQA
jgi:choline dehydrogenase-like flavoprotein